MKLIATQYGYNYWKGEDEFGVTFYNVTPIGQAEPKAGYPDSDWICNIKKVPNLFN